MEKDERKKGNRKQIFTVGTYSLLLLETLGKVNDICISELCHLMGRGAGVNFRGRLNCVPGLCEGPRAIMLNEV